jgi:hypothetical protein
MLPATPVTALSLGAFGAVSQRMRCLSAYADSSSCYSNAFQVSEGSSWYSSADKIMKFLQ